MELATKIADKSARVAVIGLGYVGLPLAVGFARAGYPVVGRDVDERKIAALNASRSYIQDVDCAGLAAVVRAGRFVAGSDYDLLRDTDAVFICVPTPFDAMKAPDLIYIEQAARGIAPRLHAGHLVIL